MATGNDSKSETFLFYTGVVLAILGIACAGVAISKGMLFKKSPIPDPQSLNEQFEQKQ